MTETVTVRGSGGAVFVMDVPEPGSRADELFQYHLGNGGLTIIEDAKPAPKKAAAPSE